MLLLRRHTTRSRTRICRTLRMRLPRIDIQPEITLLNHHNSTKRHLLPPHNRSNTPDAHRPTRRTNHSRHHPRRILNRIRQTRRPLHKNTTTAIPPAAQPRPGHLPPLFTTRHRITTQHHPHTPQPATPHTATLQQFIKPLKAK